jgi:hypothetical protein
MAGQRKSGKPPPFANHAASRPITLAGSWTVLDKDRT